MSAPRKLAYKERQELERLPQLIEALEAEHRALNDRIASPGFYREAPDRIREALARVEQLEAETAAAYARWSELESRKP